MRPWVCQRCKNKCPHEWISNEGSDSFVCWIQWCFHLGSKWHARDEYQCAVSEVSDQYGVQSSETEGSEVQAWIKFKD